ncbi:hypothetical protein LCGC14_2236470 [marine sediment metagenome]|uniref:Uncharacterized protein n=1 Tax=marine sediment metagenome TaxID=412755 RepID=A0A0F9D6I2_9ZZZZ
MFRPEGWRNGIKGSGRKVYTTDDLNLMYEAGADAMLTALSRNCDVLSELDGDDFGKDDLWQAFERVAHNQCGYLVYIPDSPDEEIDEL